MPAAKPVGSAALPSSLTVLAAPNPFNPATARPRPSPTDPLQHGGQRVCILVDRTLAAGYHTS